MDVSIPWIRDTIELITEIPEKIPNILHLIWVGSNSVPNNVTDRVNKWKELMPTWIIRVWTDNDINSSTFPEAFVEKINQANTPAQKADIMRYYIIFKFGGFYVDTDVIPHKSLECLRYLGHDVILYHDNDLTWDYIINCFFGAAPNHPVFETACKMILDAELNTTDIHFKTGPYLLGRAVSNTPPTNGRYGLLNHTFFNHREVFDGKFGTHLYAKSWVT